MELTGGSREKQFSPFDWPDPERMDSYKGKEDENEKTHPSKQVFNKDFVNRHTT